MIIVTAGHVDHGKTALIQALTGTNADRLPEEKKRGMTIDLGYAYLPLERQVIGFIDVPGHEKFLANMLAGLGGIDYAMLIVAADEGIKPQTVEHLQILSLLRLRQIIVVLSKADRVNSSQIHQLSLQIRQQFPQLATNPLFITSANTGQGISDLRDYLAQLSSDKAITAKYQPFRYAIDRVFSVKGAGTVVTGTAFSGFVKPEQILYLSTGERVRVKAIHAQNQPSEQGVAGQRLAINIATEIAKEKIKRGDWLLSQPPQTTERISIQLQAEQVLKEHQIVHFYHASSHCLAKLSLLNSRSLNLGEIGFAEVLLEQPLPLVFGDKFILRSGDDKKTLAGGKVIELNAPKRYKRSPTHLSYLTDLTQSSSIEQRLTLYLTQGAILQSQVLWTEQLLPQNLTKLLQQYSLLSYQDWLFSVQYKAKYQQNILQILHQYHQNNPDQLGISRARLARMAAVNQPEPVIFYLIDLLLTEKTLAQQNGWLHLPEYQLAFDTVEKAHWKLIEQQFQQTDQPIWVRDMAVAVGLEEQVMRNLLYKAAKLGLAVAIVKDRFYLAEDILKIAEIIRQHLHQEESISVNQLRDRLKYGRKLTVQLIEYYDRTGFLRRVGNTHLLRDEKLFS